MPLAKINQKYTRWDRSLDTGRRYLTDAPTPDQLAATLIAIDDGDIAAAVELNEEMEAKDAHLQGVAEVRRQALTALPWSITPNPSTTNTEAAETAAEFVQYELEQLCRWEDALVHLATGIGPGIAVLELVWNRGRLVEVVSVPGHRLTAGSLDDGLVYVRTTDDDVDGIRAANPKFVVFTPQQRAGFPLRVTITRAQAPLWMFKHFSKADWSAFNEVYGMPIRVAKALPGATQGEIDDAQTMLASMGSDTWAVFGENIEISLLEAARGSQPFGDAINWIENKQSILYLGQTLTTEPGNVGSLALGRVHDSVRAGLTLSDIRLEGCTIRDQIIRWMVRFRWPGADVPIPMFTRAPAEGRNLDADRVALEQLRFMAEMNLPVDTDQIYERLGWQAPKEVEKPDAL